LETLNIMAAKKNATKKIPSPKKTASPKKAAAPAAPSSSGGIAVVDASQITIRQRGRISRYAGVAEKIVALTGNEAIMLDVPAGKSAAKIRGSMQTSLWVAVKRINPDFRISVYALPDDKRLMVTRRGAKVGA